MGLIGKWEKADVIQLYKWVEWQCCIVTTQQWAFVWASRELFFDFHFFDGITQDLDGTILFPQVCRNLFMWFAFFMLVWSKHQLSIYPQLTNRVTE